MATSTAAARTSAETFVHYLHVLRRRFWIFVVPLLVAPVAAFVVAAGQPASYRATASVLVSNLDLGASLNGLPTDQSFSSQPDRALTTQAEVARSTDVAQQAVAAAGIRISAAELLSSSSVSPATNANLLNFSVQNGNPSAAVRLANAYAAAFTRYSNQLEVAPVRAALADVSAKLAQLRRNGQRGTTLYADLLDKQQRLATLETLETSNTVPVSTAADAPKVAPRPKRTAAIGAVLGLLLGAALVFVVEALDPRIRDEQEIEEILRLPLMARIPSAGSAQPASGTGFSLLQYGGALQAEAFRLLRLNLNFVALNRELGVVLVTSPRPGDGKTTTSINLALALARSGQNVILCDLDAHSPAVGQAVGLLPSAPGVTDVVLGRARLENALTTVNVQGKGETRAVDSGRLSVLGFGTLRPPNPGEFVAGDAVARLLSELRRRADIVIVDSAPLLSVGDAVALSPHVDGSLVVIRATAARRGELAETLRMLERMQSSPIGLVLTNTSVGAAAYGYGYGHANANVDAPHAGASVLLATKRVQPTDVEASADS